METIIDRVVAAAGRYEGSGSGSESGPFSGVLNIRPLLDGLGAELTYTTTGPDGSVLHDEHTLLAFNMWSGEATLYVMCSELNGVGELLQVGKSTFSNGRGANEFELQIEIVIDEADLAYVWSWGGPGDELAEQSRATLTKSG
jgi:hypothetical protein